MLETDRLLIDELSVGDAGFILDLLNTPSWLEFIGDRGVKTLSDARQYILDGPLRSYEQLGFGSYLVKLKSSGVSIGLCGLLKRDTLDDIDIGFAFLPDYIGKGYGYESATAVMTYARDVLGATRIVGITSPTNQNSIRLLEKLGLRFEKKIILRTDGEESFLYGVTLDKS
ncbi:GNAT family N-acetyltransferase [Spirosoma flavum]|uniref:GNAT family N-acetyltransferase n=1 Tax=Spirosoma flavum TaxID=2048557 RepID=A0ABW6AN71_9BACT